MMELTDEQAAVKLSNGQTEDFLTRTELRSQGVDPPPRNKAAAASSSSDPEAALRRAVECIRRDNPGLVAKQVHEKLLAQGDNWTGTTLSEVKRMCNKVAKAEVNRQTATLGGPLGHLLPTEDEPKTAAELLRDIRQDPSQRDADKIKEERPGLGNHTPRHRGDRLGTAAERGDTQQVQKLLKKGVDPNFQNSASLVTPLGVACERGHLGVVTALLEARANCELATREGYKPIHIASQFGKHRVVAELAHRGRCDVNAPCPLHDTFPLLFATNFNHVDTIEVLLRAGADPMQRVRRTRHTSLHYAFSAEAVALLVAAKADIDDNRNAGLMTPLHMACQNGYRDVCLGLLICGANYGLPNDDGFRPVEYAVETGGAQSMACCHAILGFSQKARQLKERCRLLTSRHEARMGIEELIGFEDEIDELPPEAYEDYDNLADPLNLFQKAGRSDLPLGEERALTLTEQDDPGIVMKDNPPPKGGNEPSLDVAAALIQGAAAAAKAEKEQMELSAAAAMADDVAEYGALMKRAGNSHSRALAHARRLGGQEPFSQGGAAASSAAAEAAVQLDEDGIPIDAPDFLDEAEQDEQAAGRALESARGGMFGEGPGEKAADKRTAPAPTLPPKLTTPSHGHQLSAVNPGRAEPQEDLLGRRQAQQREVNRRLQAAMARNRGEPPPGLVLDQEAAIAEAGIGDRLLDQEAAMAMCERAAGERKLAVMEAVRAGLAPPRGGGGERLSPDDGAGEDDEDAEEEEQINEAVSALTQSVFHHSLDSRALARSRRPRTDGEEYSDLHKLHLRLWRWHCKHGAFSEPCPDSDPWSVETAESRADLPSTGPVTLAQHLLSRFHAIPRKQLEMGGKAMWAQMLDGAKNLNKLAKMNPALDIDESMDDALLDSRLVM